MVLDERCVCQYANPALLQIIGGDAAGQAVLNWMHPDEVAVLPDAMAACRSRPGQPREIEFRFRPRAGAFRHFRGFLTVLPHDRPAGFVLYCQDVTECHRLEAERSRAERELRESRRALGHSREELRALAARLLTTAEEERKRISRELHDDINQRLASLAMELGTLARTAPALCPQLHALEERALELSDDTRRLAHQLHPTVLEDLGLVPALEAYCADFARRKGLTIRFTRRSLPAHLPQDVRLTLYRVAQECLSNAARHAGTERVLVSVTGRPGEVRLSVKDFGCGFDPARTQHKGGLGIISMEERVRLVQGKLAIAARPGRGTRVSVAIPLCQERLQEIAHEPPATAARR